MGTSATRVLTGRDDPTGATRVAAPRTTRQPATAPTTARPARRREPQPYATGPQTRAPRDRAAERGATGRRSGRRFATFLALLCLFAAAVIIAVVIATGTSNTAVQVRRTIANDVNSATDIVSASDLKKTPVTPVRIVSGRKTTTGVMVEPIIGTVISDTAVCTASRRDWPRLTCV